MEDTERSVFHSFYFTKRKTDTKKKTSVFECLLMNRPWGSCIILAYQYLPFKYSCVSTDTVSKIYHNLFQSRKTWHIINPCSFAFHLGIIAEELQPGGFLRVLFNRKWSLCSALQAMAYFNITNIKDHSISRATWWHIIWFRVKKMAIIILI